MTHTQTCYGGFSQWQKPICVWFFVFTFLPSPLPTELAWGEFNYTIRETWQLPSLCANCRAANWISAPNYTYYGRSARITNGGIRKLTLAIRVRLNSLIYSNLKRNKQTRKPMMTHRPVTENSLHDEKTHLRLILCSVRLIFSDSPPKLAWEGFWYTIRETW